MLLLDISACPVRVTLRQLYVYIYMIYSYVSIHLLYLYIYIYPKRKSLTPPSFTDIHEFLRINPFYLLSICHIAMEHGPMERGEFPAHYSSQRVPTISRIDMLVGGLNPSEKY